MRPCNSSWKPTKKGRTANITVPVVAGILIFVNFPALVDGTYYGKVDNYDGAFQHLELRSGTHEVEIRANGYETIQWQIRVLPGKTLTYNGEMKVLK